VRQRGSVTVVMAAVLAVTAMVAALTAEVGRAIRVRGRAQTVADAAALAAAQELIHPSADPEAVASEYAERHGGALLACDCDGPDEVTVEVELAVSLPFLGPRTVRARARAVVAAPAGSEGLQPWFVARLTCLFARVPGLWVVSGFRTRAEQARLHREKPHLAAPPGHSMHELGLAADLGYPSPGARAATHAVAPACGLRYPVPHEPWHVEPA